MIFVVAGCVAALEQRKVEERFVDAG